MPNERPNPQLPLAQVKGTWEERESQVFRLLAQNEPAALQQSQELIERLGRVPPHLRAAAGDRLNNVLLAAIMNQARYLAVQERYTEAAATLTRSVPILPEDVRDNLTALARAYYLNAGQTDAVLAEMDAIAVAGDIDAWMDVLFVALRCDDLARARSSIDAGEQWINRTYQLAYDTPEARRDMALLSTMKARLAVAEGRAADALAWFQHAMTLDDFYRNNPSFMYRHLVDMGAMSEALTLIRMDAVNPVRAGFWTGLVDYRRGETGAARHHWQRAAQAELPAEGDASLLEFVLNHYYLGDNESTGLAAAMDLLNSKNPGWGAFFLAGLGWALRGDMQAARTDMRHARSDMRASGGGRLIPAEMWRFCWELLDAERCDLLKEYFEDDHVQRDA